MDVMAVILSIELHVCAIAIPLHIFGIYVLQLLQRRSQQVIILISLSAAQIVLMLGTSVSVVAGLVCYKNDIYAEVINVLGFKETVVPLPVRIIIKYMMDVGSGQVNLSLMLLTLDRFVSTVLPHKYSVAAENSNVFKKLLISSWCFTSLTAVFGVCRRSQHHFDCYMFMQTCLTVLVIIITYALIGMKIVRSRRTVTRTNSAGSNRKTLLMSICIVATYIFFYVIPSPVVIYHSKTKARRNGEVKRNHVVAESLQCLSLVGSIADVLIYVLLTNSNREYIYKLCCPCRGVEDPEGKMDDITE